MDYTHLIARLPQRQPDAFVNLSYLCKCMRKKFSNYWRLARTKNFIAEVQKTGVAAIFVGRKAIGSDKGTPTWGCKEVAIDIIEWSKIPISELERMIPPRVEQPLIKDTMEDPLPPPMESSTVKDPAKKTALSLPALPPKTNKPEMYDPRFPKTPKIVRIPMPHISEDKKERETLGPVVYANCTRRHFSKWYDDWDDQCVWGKPGAHSKWKSVHLEYTGGKVPFKEVGLWSKWNGVNSDGHWEYVEFPEPIVEHAAEPPVKLDLNDIRVIW
jgi:hypothetical protein